jgi:hypothetical protein
VCEVDRQPRVEAPGRLWQEVDEFSDAAIPAPVRTLFGRINKR